MSLVSLEKILTNAEKGSYAVPAFNVYNMETVMGVAKAAEELASPVIFQIYSRLFQTNTADYLVPIVLEAISKLNVEAAFHLDHGSGVPIVMRAIRLGASGVMIDASALPLEENIKATHEVVNISRSIGVSVEGELGHIGSTSDNQMTAFTDIEEAKKFTYETKISALAIMVGTAHGRYKSTPNLDIERIHKIKEAVQIPLVLHGGSGVPDEQITEAIKAGIRKINFGTDVCYSFLDAVFNESRSTYALDQFMKNPINSVKEYAKEKIKLLGASHQCTM